MKRVFKVIAPVLVLAVGVGSAMVLSAAKPAPEQSEPEPRLISLYVDEVQEDTVTISVQSHGEVRAKTEIDLLPEVSGRIQSIAPQFAEGAAFGPNTTLLKIDDSNYKLALIRAEARVAEARVQVEMALADAAVKQKQRKLYSSNTEATPLALHQPQVDEAQAKLRSAEADLAEARLNLARTEIKVPFHGRIVSKAVGVGQFVTAGTNLGRVFATDTVEVRLSLTDSQLQELNLPIGFVAEGTDAPKVNLSAVVGNEQHIWEGRIVRTHAKIDQETRLIYAIAEVDGPYDASRNAPLAVGMFVTAEIAGVNEQTALVMPRLALRNRDQVYVINTEDKLEIRTVEVLSTSEDRVLVSGGVSAGERVVTSTLPNAVEGMAVQALSRIASL